MKSKGILKVFLPVIALLLGLSVSSCHDDHYGPSPYFYDSYLTGYWKLMQIDGMGIPEYRTNYLYFDGYGSGLYYYYDRGQLFYKKIKYDCRDSWYSSSEYVLNILYQGESVPQTMNYSFSRDGYTLYVWWRENGRTITYTYANIPYFPF